MSLLTITNAIAVLTPQARLQERREGGPQGADRGHVVPRTANMGGLGLKVYGGDLGFEAWGLGFRA